MQPCSPGTRAHWVRLAGIALVLSLALGAMALSSAVAATLIVGNDTSLRANTDTYYNFTVIDTNNPVTTPGFISSFRYYASTTNPFRFVLVNQHFTVEWVSSEITPAATGVNTFTPAVPVVVAPGWNAGLYYPGTGTVTYSYTGAPAYWTLYGSGMPAVGSTLTINDPLGQGRQYSFVGTVTPLGKDACKQGGWQQFGTQFKNQGDCVSFVATGGANGPSGQ